MGRIWAEIVSVNKWTGLYSQIGRAPSFNIIGLQFNRKPIPLGEAQAKKKRKKERKHIGEDDGEACERRRCRRSTC